MNTSSKNTKNASAPDQSPLSLSVFDPPSDDGDNQKNAALAVLQEQIEAAEDARREERFVWIVICTILINILWFQGSENATLPVIVLILELVVLLVLARRMGIDDIVQLMDRLLHAVTQSGSKNP